MKGLLLLAVAGAAVAGCAGDGVQLKQDHSYVVEWIGERPLMDYAHLTVTLGALMPKRWRRRLSFTATREVAIALRSHADRT